MSIREKISENIRVSESAIEIASEREYQRGSYSIREGSESIR